MDKSKVHIKHGLWIALIVICISVIVNIFGVYKIDAVSYSMYVVIIVLLIIFCFQYKNLNRSTAGFANIFAHGFKTACVTALIIIIWNLLSAKIIFKDQTEAMLEDRKQEMIAQGMEKDAVEKQAEFAKKNFVLLTISSTLMLYAVTGVVGSLIGAALAKNNKPD